jgi:hypothetical protein
MSQPNGDQADPFNSPATTSQPSSSFQEPVAPFTASTSPAATAPTVPVTPTFTEPAQGVHPGLGQGVPSAPAPSLVPSDPATQPVYTAGLAQGVPPGLAQGVTSAPAPSVDPATQPVYPPGAATVPAAVGTDPALPAVPGYAPGYAAPGSTAAVPVTGVPVSGYPGYPTVLEPKKKRTGTIVLTVATIVLGLTTVAFGTLYFLEMGARGKADRKVSEQTALLAEADKKVKDTESRLATSKEENTKLTQDLTGAKNKTDEVTKARDALAACMQASDAYAAAKNTNTARDLIVKCTEAEKYY